MQICVLNSGSNANATVLMESGCALLVDCGLSARETYRRLDEIARDIEIIGILVTHEHSDHTQGIRPVSRRSGASVFATADTIAYGGARLQGIIARPVVQFEEMEIGPFRVTPIPLLHDASDPVGYMVEAGGSKAVVATDLGQVTLDLKELMAGADGIVLEANHDLDMLLKGRYPPELKTRILGPLGHLSNDDSGSAIAEASPNTAFLAHLSMDNNTEEKALSTVEEALIVKETDVELVMSHRDRATDLIEI